ncbi:MAG: acetate--CoA ligase family protein [Clostridia bacterium]|nr:acetate--CoA ligase family protein [Clostridia bacterium]
MNIESLFSPKSVAIVGVSDKPGFGSGAAREIAKGVLKDNCYYIHPKRDELFGRKCYRSLAELPQRVDCVVLCTNANLAIDYAEQAGQLGAKALVVYASGFREEHTPEGDAREDQLIAICEKYGMALSGPNNMGLCNRVGKVNLRPAGPSNQLDIDIDCGLGIVGQSGYILSNLYQQCFEHTAYLVSSGNGNMVRLEDYMLYFANSEHCNAIAVYLEGIKDAGVFTQALRVAAEKEKPVIILKSGRGERGTKAASSHTGQMAGAYTAYQSIFNKYGVISVTTLDEFVATAKLMTVLGKNLPQKPGIGAINFSGGENTLCADLSEEYGLDVPAFQPETVKALSEIVPSYSTVNNPLDPTTTMFTQCDKVQAMLEAIANDPGVGLVLIGDDLSEPPAPKDVTINKVVKTLRDEGKNYPIVLVPSFERPRCEQIKAELAANGVPLLGPGRVGYSALRHLFDYCAYRRDAHTLSIAAPDKKRARLKKVALSEADSKREMRLCGVPVPKQFIAYSKEDILVHWNNMALPLVLKINSPDISHKTEAGGVRLNINDRETACRAFGEIISNCTSYNPKARIEGILVQEMAPAGQEIIVGVTNDAQFGPMILVGLGGVFVEVFKDVSVSVCPINKTEAMDMIGKLRSFKLLNGYRGSEPLDVEALAELLVNVSNYALAHKDDLAELDLNPVMVYPKGVKAVDALVVRYEQGED